MSNVKLSVCLVVKNEEKHLHRCLTSIKNAAYEIVVVDTGSTDSTIEIAQMYTSRVFKIKWRDDFSRARNYALAQASGDWILFLDGDEELEANSLQSLQKRIRNHNYEGYLIKVLNYFQAGSQIEISPDMIFRLFKNRVAYRYSGIIHEQIYDNILAVNPDANIGLAEDICIIHYGYLKEEITAKKKVERNTRLLKKAVRKNPNNLLDRFHLGMEYFRANQHDRALQEFLFVLDKVDFRAIYAPKLMRYITKCHYLQGNLDEALRFIEAVWSKQFGDHGDLYYLKGLILKDLKRQAEAYAAFQQCLTLPVQPAYYANLYSQSKEKTYLRLGELAEELGDKKKALKYFAGARNEKIKKPI